MAVLAPSDPRHGTINAYKNHGCRCEVCKGAQREEQAKYRKSTGRAYDRAWGRAHGRARRQLIARHRREFDRLMAKALDEEWPL